MAVGAFSGVRVGSGFRLTVVQRLALGLAMTAVLCAAIVLVAARQPWLGLGLAPAAEGTDILVTSVSPGGPAAGRVAPGSRLVAISAPGGAGRIALAAIDVIEEPDAVENYDRYNAFMQRQSAIHALLTRGPAELHVVRPGEAPATIAVQALPARPVGDLPFAFWFQMGCAVVIMVIALWVTALRPQRRDVSLFAWAGYGVVLSALAASVYSTRELALDGSLFLALGLANHAGAMMFAIFMIGLFTVYPVDLRLSWLFRIAAVVLSGWYVVNALQLFPDNVTGFYLGILLAMLTIIALIALQYRATRGDLAARKALLWLGITVLVGAGAFTVLMALPILVGVQPVLSQAYSFGFFPIIYLGVALGLTRYRLFDLDRLALDVLTYLLAAVLFLVIDILLVTALAVNLSVSVAITAIIVGLVYLPLRNHLVARMTGDRDSDPFELFQASTEIALQPTREQRAERWQAALEKFFRPLSLAASPVSVARPVIRDDGTALALPAYDWSPALELRHNAGGKRLFGPPHARIVEKLSGLVSEAERSRRAYDRGVTEERHRIGRDLHDNVGAMLLSSLAARDDTASRQFVRSALGDIKEIVNGLSADSEPLGHVVAELRAETFDRLAGRPVRWPAGDADEASVSLPYPAYRAFTSAHREMISNAVRHGGQGEISIETSVVGGMLVHRVTNALPEGTRQTGGIGGHGLANLSRRSADIGGEFVFAVEEGRAVAEIRLPVLDGAAR
jgi:two-component system, NarL family, sensor histidine kinase DevS